MSGELGFDEISWNSKEISTLTQQCKIMTFKQKKISNMTNFRLFCVNYEVWIVIISSDKARTECRECVCVHMAC